MRRLSNAKDARDSAATAAAANHHEVDVPERTMGNGASSETELMQTPSP